MIATRQNIVPTGVMIKVKVHEFDDELLEIINNIDTENLLVPEIIEEWLEQVSTNDEFKNIKLMTIDEYSGQFNTMPSITDSVKKINTFEGTRMFIPFVEIQRLDKNDLKRHEELSGEGLIITKYMMTFTDFNKKYLLDKTQEAYPDFFELSDGQFIVNSIRLTVDGATNTIGKKLTGRAAEIQARREKNQKDKE
jgi:hypothetical protein